METGSGGKRRGEGNGDGGTGGVYTLLVEVGRKPGDGLPDDCDGAALVCYCDARGEEEAVRETVKLLTEAGLAPLEVQSYGTEEERIAEGHEIGGDDRVLMARAREENAVIIAQMVPFTDDGDANGADGADGPAGDGPTGDGHG